MNSQLSYSSDESYSLSDRLPLVLSFLMPIVIMIGILIGKGIYPFGENSFLRTDMYHQYAPFFAHFARALKNGDSLTYSFEIGLGSNFVALFAYYLSSPFNWLLILIPSGFVIEFMTALIVLKIGLCGFTMGIYLRVRSRTNNLWIPFIGICYAMCGYLAAYSWNIMWLDCLWLAPLILLGLERLVRQGRPFLYCITLGLAILTNYYISIMLCIFMVLYFICEIVLLPRMKLRDYLIRLGLFAAASLVAGGLAAILLLPAAKALMTTASADSTFPTSLTSYFSVLEMLARHMVNVEVEIGLDHWPNLYSGVICMIAYPLYLMSQKVDAKDKIVKTILLALLLLSFSLNIPNYIWHGMHYPNSLPCRQSFLYTIVLLAMCYEGLCDLRERSKGQLTACFWGNVAFVLVCQTVITADEFEYYVFYLTLLFIGLYLLLFYLAKTGRLLRATAVILCVGLVIAETGMNMAVTSVTTTSRTEYWKNTRNYQALLAQAQAQDTSGFYRVEKSSRRTKNDGAWVGYTSASIFSSTTQAAISDFYKTFGMEGNTNAYSFTGATPLMASLLSVRYTISATEMDETATSEFMNWEDTAYLYRNLYTQNLGFMLPSDVSSYFAYYNGDPADAQNSLVNLSTGSGDVLEETEMDVFDAGASFTVEEKGHYFVYVENSDIEDVTAHVGNSDLSFENVDRGYLLDLGICEPGEEVTVEADDTSLSMEATAYRFNDDAFIDWYTRISAQSLTVEECVNTLTKTSLSGSITATEDGTLFTSLPYDTGWTVLLDGAPVTTEAFANTFLVLPLTAGTHTLSFTYHVPGLAAGAAISLVSLVLLIVLFVLSGIYDRKKAPGRRHRWDSSRRAKSGMSSQEAWLAERKQRLAQAVSGLDDRKETPPEDTHELSDNDIEEILLEDEEYLEPPEEPEAPADGEETR